jgi:hypothetical protein
MPKIQLGGALPDAKQGELASRFKYGMFGHRMHDYDIKHKTLSLAMFGMETSVISAYHTTRLIRYLWEQIRSAFKVKTQRIYDSYFDKLVDMSYDALIEYNQYASRCYPNRPQPTFFLEKNQRLTKVIRGAYRQLNSLCDKSGFGNKQIKDFSAETYSKRNMME